MGSDEAFNFYLRALLLAKTSVSSSEVQFQLLSPLLPKVRARRLTQSLPRERSSRQRSRGRNLGWQSRRIGQGWGNDWVREVAKRPAPVRVLQLVVGVDSGAFQILERRQERELTTLNSSSKRIRDRPHFASFAFWELLRSSLASR
ncbi:hypothetical protein BT69DRAFT_138643 [Atractiella rhizophila]|nr:hypothetical protein BT69DRAFT_138643 [Atractiella rhizophila]